MKRIVLMVGMIALANMACALLKPFQSGEEGEIEAQEIGTVSDALPDITLSVEEVADAGQEEIVPQAEEPIPIPEVTVHANPVFFPLKIEYEPSGNGLQIAKLWFYLENASTEWHTYALTFFGGSQPLGQADSHCLWNRGWGESSSPVLRTAEGGEYSALRDSESCGQRWVPAIPPGLVVTGVGETFSSVEALGWAKFEIPENAHPESVMFWHHRAQTSIGEEKRGWETANLVIDSDYNGPMPFDPLYGADIFQVGETIEVGEFATVAIDRTGDGQGASLSVAVTVSSLHTLYPINIVTLQTTLVDEEGVICCFMRRREWGIDFNTKRIGPGYSYSASHVFDIPDGKRVWLLGQVTVQEESSSEVKGETAFVVELP